MRAKIIALPIQFCCIVLLCVGAAGAAEGDPIKIYKLGNPATTISTERAETKEDLQRLVDKYRNALNVALAQSGYTVYPDDLYEAAKNAEPVSVAVGETYHWMVFRKNGQPSITSRPVVWSAKNGKPFQAWRLHFASGDKLFTFDIPKTCLNLALKKVEDIPVPTCSLQARHQPASAECGELGTVAISGSGAPIASVTSTGGKVTAAGSQRWTFTPSAAGSFTFEAETEPDRYGKTATCSATVRVPAAKPCDPVCRLRGSYDATTGDIDLDASGSEGTVEITGVTLPDGSAGDAGAVRSAGGNRWAYTPVVGKKAGDYTFTFEGQATRAGRTVDCDATVVVPVVKPDRGAWILRLYGARIDGDDSVNTATPGIDGFGELTWTALQSGTGVGIALERLFTDRVGLEANFLYGEIDAEYMADRIDSWVMDEDNVSFRMLTLGPNFHLTPGRRADVYIGPFVGIVQYGTAVFDVPTGLVRMSFDDDFGFGGQVGLDVPFGASRWGFHSALRYVATSAEQEGGLNREFDYDPLIFGAGFAFRF